MDRRTVKFCFGLALTTLLWQGQSSDALRVQIGSNGQRPLQSDVWGSSISDQLWNSDFWNDLFVSDFIDDIFQMPRWHHSLVPERHQIGRSGANCQLHEDGELESDSQHHGWKRDFSGHCDRQPSCHQVKDGEINKPVVRQENGNIHTKQQELERLRADNAKRQQELIHEREELLKQQKHIEDELRQQAELKHQQELQMERQQLEMRKQKEAERRQQEQLQQQAVERQRQKELQDKRQRDLELQRQRQQELELQRQRQRELELQRQRDIELQRQRERQKELELQRQRQQELEQRQRDIELQRQRQKELDLQRQRQKLQEERMRQQEQLRQGKGSTGYSSTGHGNHNSRQDSRSSNQQHMNNQHARHHQNTHSRQDSRSVNQQYMNSQHGRHHQNQHGHMNTNNAQQMGQRVELLSLAVKDYDPEDFSISTHDSDLLLEGRHVCGCEENCFERELERKVKLPRGIDTLSLSASYNKDGVLKIEGMQHRNAVPLKDVHVPVQGVRLHRNTAPCRHLKSGIKLKKMNRATGEIFDDIPTVNSRTRLFENEFDGDGVTIETEEYY